MSHDSTSVGVVGTARVAPLSSPTQPTPPRRSPYVSLSAHCDLLHFVGGHPHAYSTISAETIRDRALPRMYCHHAVPASIAACERAALVSHIDALMDFRKRAGNLDTSQSCEKAHAASDLPYMDVAPLSTDALWPCLDSVERTLLRQADAKSAAGRTESDTTHASPLLPSGLQQAQDAFCGAFGIRPSDALTSSAWSGNHGKSGTRVNDDHALMVTRDSRVSAVRHGEVDENSFACRKDTGEQSGSQKDAPLLKMSSRGPCAQRCFHGTVLQRTLLQALLILHLPNRSPAAQFALRTYHTTLVVIPSPQFESSSRKVHAATDDEVGDVHRDSCPAVQCGRSLSFVVRPNSAPDSVLSPAGCVFTLYELLSPLDDIEPSSTENSHDYTNRCERCVIDDDDEWEADDGSKHSPGMDDVSHSQRHIWCTDENEVQEGILRVGCSWRCWCQPCVTPSPYSCHAERLSSTFTSVDDEVLSAFFTNGHTYTPAEDAVHANESHAILLDLERLLRVVQHATYTTNTVSQLMTHILQTKLFVWPNAGPRVVGHKRERDHEQSPVGGYACAQAMAHCPTTQAASVSFTSPHPMTTAAEVGHRASAPSFQRNAVIAFLQARSFDTYALCAHVAWHLHLRAVLSHEMQTVLSNDAQTTVSASYTLLSTFGLPAPKARGATHHRWRSALLLCRPRAATTVESDGGAPKPVQQRSGNRGTSRRSKVDALAEGVLAVVFLVGCDSTLRWGYLAPAQPPSGTCPMTVCTEGQLELWRRTLQRHLRTAFATQQNDCHHTSTDIVPT